MANGVRFAWLIFDEGYGGLAFEGEGPSARVPEATASALSGHSGDVVLGIRPEDIADPEYAPPGIIGAPVDRPKVLETTALGAAWLAGMQAGLYPDQDAFAREWALDRRFDPEMDAPRRETKYESWKRAVTATMSV